MENELLCQLMPLGTIRTLATSKETPFSSDLDYYQMVEAKVLLQVCVSIRYILSEFAAFEKNPENCRASGCRCTTISKNS